MTTREHINEYFNGRPFMILCAIALMVVAAVALSMGVRPAPVESTGIFFSFGQVLIEAGPLSAAVNVLGLLATGGIMLALNKVFSYVRSVTHLFVSVFFLLQLAPPIRTATRSAAFFLSLPSWRQAVCSITVSWL